MKTIRTFIAVEIDQGTKQKLSNLISLLKKSNADIKWVNENQMHITLKFLGNIGKGELQKISAALKSIANNFNDFTIQLSKIGGFPNLRRPRVIWIGIAKGSESLEQLNANVELAMERLGFDPSASLGTGKERRNYKAHFTLGRVKSLKNIQELLSLIDEVDFQSQDKIKIDKLILFQSTLTPQGAIYTPLAEYSLQLH